MVSGKAFRISGVWCGKGGRQVEPAQRPDEIFDVVDERDRVIGQSSRREVHEKGLFHRAVHVLILNHSNKIFLQKRSMAKDVHPGCWDSSASGHLDKGEDYLPAIEREIQEELGVQAPRDLRFLFKLEPSRDNGWEFVKVYTGLHSGPFKLNPAEISEGQWWTSEEVAQSIRSSPGIWASSFLEVWRNWLCLADPENDLLND